MFMIVAVLLFGTAPIVTANDLLEECAKYYNPPNYLDRLDQIRMPYNDEVEIPNNLLPIHNQLKKNIQPTPAMTTKVVTVKTKYVYKSPVCVKFTKKQKLCQQQKGIPNKLITKHNFYKENVENRVETSLEVLDELPIQEEPERFNLKVSFDKLIEPSESREGRNYHHTRTPSMNPHKIQELLIEDRLDQLETILPQYHRRRTYETKTIYVTKTVANHHNMATLTVKNCVPIGYDICPQTPRRKTKTSNFMKNLFYSKF